MLPLIHLLPSWVVEVAGGIGGYTTAQWGAIQDGTIEGRMDAYGQGLVSDGHGAWM